MSIKILQNKQQIESARQEMDNRKISCIDSPDSYIRSALRRLGLVSNIVMGDRVKSWDVLNTINFIENHVKKDEPILDIGCYCSEVLASLHKIGYSNLFGADLNPNIKNMPYSETIKYEKVDFMNTNYESHSFQAITSISVIEHGFNPNLLLKEISRLLKPDGYFIASFDYWPEKIDTTQIQFFGMDWKIFSENDVIEFISQASGYGLTPTGEMSYTSDEKPINCAKKEYTFAWLSLKKTA